MAGVQPTGFLAKRKTTKKDAMQKDAWFGTFSPILDKEQGGYEALLGRPWLQPGWFMTGLIKKSIKQGNAAAPYLLIRSWLTGVFYAGLALCGATSHRSQTASHPTLPLETKRSLL